MTWHDAFRIAQRWRLFGLAAGATLLGVAGIWLSTSSKSSSESAAPDGNATPPWVFGRSDARFRIVEFADLECPYCRAYFSHLQQLVQTHAEVSWEWRHLPLSIHEPRATQLARVAECAGEQGGNSAFWKAVEGIYRNEPPVLSARIKRCLSSRRSDVIIAAQAAEARQAKVDATPTLRIVDQKSGRSIALQGMIETDALLSAMDWLAAPERASDPVGER